jgi:hypothetical protein
MGAPHGAMGYCGSEVTSVKWLLCVMRFLKILPVLLLMRHQPSPPACQAGSTGMYNLLPLHSPTASLWFRSSSILILTVPWATSLPFLLHVDQSSGYWETLLGDHSITKAYSFIHSLTLSFNYSIDTWDTFKHKCWALLQGQGYDRLLQTGGVKPCTKVHTEGNHLCDTQE